ncbi:uncharacterized protein LOC117816507 [Xyrichtys novacula]|uniref:Uncharacterized protein LOC117816507 n=1 Tax=Xyrichtys novacula TaxID=13765 RepID=A0AAV1EU74_XYRNO|nr:uncharacterized protein LOC117816507 [Xyrichtys novacula]
MKMCAAAAAAVVVLLSLFSVGLSAPLTSCESLLKPITITREEILGRWMYIGGSSNIPGSRSVAHLMTSVWVDLSATSQENVLSLLQSQKIYGDCSSFLYNVTFQNSVMLIEEPFFLKEVYLPTECPDCLLAIEDIVSGTDNFRSLLLFSRSKSVPPAMIEMLKRQAVCLQMPSPIIMKTDEEPCRDDITPEEGLDTLNKLLESKMGLRVARVLDSLFDYFWN